MMKAAVQMQNTAALMESAEPIAKSRVFKYRPSAVISPKTTSATTTSAHQVMQNAAVSAT